MMTTNGYFLRSQGIVSGGGEDMDVRLNGDRIIFSPIDPIYVDENSNVFYSKENKNSYMYANSDGKIFVKVVR